MDATDSSPPAEIYRVAVRLQPFWAERPALWLAQAEAQFSLASISSEKTKFFHVISQLNHQYAAEVEDIIISPPEWEPYTTLRVELMRQLLANFLRSKRWTIVSRSNSCGISGVLCLTYQNISCLPSGPAGYTPTYRPTSPVSQSAACTLQRAVQTESPRSLPSRQSPALHHFQQHCT
jgi:hypothetical protein